MSTYNDIHYSACGYLARREHSQSELKQKLVRKFSDIELIEKVIENLANANLQSDLRYAESMIRHRVNKGYGWNYIYQYLRQRKISDEVISKAKENAEIDWDDLKQEVYRKRFANKEPADFKEKAKRMAFMRRRGF